MKFLGKKQKQKHKVSIIQKKKWGVYNYFQFKNPRFIFISIVSIIWVLYVCVVLNSDRSKGNIKLEVATGGKRDINLKTEWKWNGLCLGRPRFLTAVNRREKNTLKKEKKHF